MFKELQKKRVLTLKLGPRQTVVSIISDFSLKGPEDPLWLLLKGEHSRWKKRQKQARNEETEGGETWIQPGQGKTCSLNAVQI